MGKKVSIIIPVYNGSNYVREAIDSALAQTYKDVEVIVVNDGSCDNGATREVALSYGDKIKYYEKENGGVSTALNYGIEKMTGEYFSWLSHDDIYYPNKIERQMEEIKKHDKNTILFANYDLIDSNGVKFDTVCLDHVLLTKKPDYAVFRGMIGGITLLIPKRAFDECGGFSVEYRCVQDYLKWYDFLQNYKFVHMEDVLSATRIHSNQDTFTSPRMKTEGSFLWTHITEEYPKNKKIECEGSEYLFYYKMANYLSSTPYVDAMKANEDKANAFFDKEKNEIKNGKKVTLSAIVIDNGCYDDVVNTINSLEKQNYKNITIIIEGDTKYKKYSNTKNRSESLKNIDTDFCTFINAGVIVEDDFILNQLAVASLTNKALVISDYPLDKRRNLVDNLCSLLINLDGVIINCSYKAKYEYDYQFLYELAKSGGCIIVNKDFLSNRKIDYKMKEVYDYLELVIRDRICSGYEIATLNYDISCIFNKYAHNLDKVYMYEPCNEYKSYLFSRSFQILKKYIDKKKARNKRI